jgi:hypothetical protein
MPKKIPTQATEVAVAAQAQVTKQYVLKRKEGVPQVEDQTLVVHRFITEPTRIDARVGITLNLGNFEFARIDVGVVVPCYKEEMDDAFVWARDWATERLKSEIDSVRNKSDTSIL